MKICTTCKIEKSLIEFNRNKVRKDGYQTVCRDCNRERARRYYAENREKHIEVTTGMSKKYRERNQKWICEYLSDHPCVDCENNDIRVLDFDHQGEKEGNVGDYIGAPVALVRLEREVAKCEVRCANCHRIKTENTSESYRCRYQASIA